MNQSNHIEEEEEEEELKELQKEIELEADQEKVSKFEEIHINKDQKFFEINVENCQYYDNQEQKYKSLGRGMFSLQKEENKNIGQIVIRDNQTKNIKMQGVLIQQSQVEKISFKNLEIVVIKSVYGTIQGKLSSLTNVRIKVDSYSVEKVYKKCLEFNESLKK